MCMANELINMRVLQSSAIAKRREHARDLIDAHPVHKRAILPGQKRATVPGKMQCANFIVGDLEELAMNYW